MKKIFYVILVCLLTLTFIGCTSKEENNSQNDENKKLKEVSLKEPIINWWKVSKFASKDNILVMELENPNNDTIDFTFDVIHYLNDEDVGTSKNLYYHALKSHEKGIVMFDWNVKETDNISVNFKNLEKSYYVPSSYKVLKNEINADGYIDIDIEVQNEYTSGSVYIVGYSGKEIVGVYNFDFYEQTGVKNKIEILTPFDRYDTYYNIYK